jgi:hypothetical protein
VVEPVRWAVERGACSSRRCWEAGPTHHGGVCAAVGVRLCGSTRGHLTARHLVWVFRCLTLRKRFYSWLGERTRLPPHGPGMAVRGGRSRGRLVPFLVGSADRGGEGCPACDRVLGSVSTLHGGYKSRKARLHQLRHITHASCAPHKGFSGLNFGSSAPSPEVPAS